MYYVVYGFLWLVSLLPLRVLYFFGDGIYLFMYYVMGYRKKVVFNNLSIAFPEKSIKERTVIAKQFYHNLIDTFIETIKMITVSFDYIDRRVKANWDIVNKYYDSGVSIQVHLGHNFNWEWGNSILGHKVIYKPIAVYMPIANKTLERIFYKLRSRSGVVLLPATDMRNSFLPHRNTQYVLGLAVDQSPGHPGNAWWVNFFGRPTAFVKGPAKAALANGTKVMFAFIHKPKRGYYHAVISEPDIDLSTVTEQELTVKFVRYLEDIIKQYPDMWLWSHRRWKLTYDPSYGPLIS